MSGEVEVLLIAGNSRYTSGMSNEHLQNPPEPELNLISLAEAAQQSGLSHGYLRRLVRSRKVWGMKIGRNWVTTEKAVQEYLVTERRPGPK